MSFALTGAELGKVYPGDADTKFGQPGEGAEFGNELPCTLGTIVTITKIDNEDAAIKINPGRYKLVRYDPDDPADTPLPRTGDVVSYKSLTPDPAGSGNNVAGYGANVVTGDNSESGDIGAGVVASYDISIAQAGATQGARTKEDRIIQSGEYFWIQIEGVCTLRNTLGANPGDGDALEVSDTDLTLQRRGSDSQRAQVAIATDASAKQVMLGFTA